MEINTRIFQENSNKKTKFIDFELEGKVLKRTWGLIEGKTQTTSHTYSGLNIGKSNELTPEEVSYNDYIRIIEKKTKEGYKTSISETTDIKKEIDWSRIDTSFCCSKPISKPNIKKIDKTLKEGNCSIEKKYNGLCHYILITDTGKVKIYTRRIDDHTRKYPKIVKEIKEKFLPPKSIFISEFCVQPETDDHLESFKKMSSIHKTNTLKGKLKEDQSKSLKLQEKNPVYCLIFGVLYFHGDPVWEDMSHTDQKLIIYQNFEDFTIGKYLKIPKEYKFKSFNEMKKYLQPRKKRIEGFVAWMDDEKLEVTMNGKPNRRAAFKIKIPFEDDFIAYDWFEGKGKKQGRIGSLKFGKMKDEKIVHIGTVGSGLKDSDLNPDNWDFPCVVVLEYASIFSTGALQHPVFICRHGDKTPEEVTF